MTMLETRPRPTAPTVRAGPPGPAAPRPLLGGICARIATALGIDVAWPRAAFALTAVAGGAGVLVYLGAWLAFPTGRSLEAMTSELDAQAGLLAGGILIAMGLMLFVGTVAGWIGSIVIWPATVLIGGVVLLRAARPAAR